MRSDKYYEEDRKKQELKDRITVILVAGAIAITSSAIVYKIEENKLETMINYYETLIQETNEKSYLEGFLDGVFGVQNKYYTYSNTNPKVLIKTNN